MFAFRRVVGAALEDFGLRRRPDAPLDPADEVEAPPEAAREPEAEPSPPEAAALEPARPRERRRTRRRAAALLDALALGDGGTATDLAMRPSHLADTTSFSTPAAASAVEAPPRCLERSVHVVWQGAARRSGELQRFVDHLEATKTASLDAN